MIPKNRILQIAELTRQQAEVAENAWDAAIKRKYYESASSMELWQRPEIPPDKDTYLEKFKEK